MGAEKLKQVLRDRGITNFELTLMTRISASDISQVINGKKPCFPKWRKKIANALEMSEEVLFPEYVKPEV